MVSIIVPNYNHALFLNQRIDSILNQTYQDFELILLDDASTDESRTILEAYREHPKVTHLLFNETNSGSPFIQWMKGVDLAQGDYIWIAESDDYAQIDFLERLMIVFDATPQTDVVFSGTLNVQKDTTPIKSITKIERVYKELFEQDFTKKGMDFLKLFMPNYCVIRNASSVLFKRNVVSINQRNVIHYKAIGDFYFWVSLCVDGCRFAYVSDKLNCMRRHPNTVRKSGKKDHYKALELQKIQKYVLKTCWFRWDIVKSILAYNYYEWKAKS